MSTPGMDTVVTRSEGLSFSRSSGRENIPREKFAVYASLWHGKRAHKQVKYKVTSSGWAKLSQLSFASKRLLFFKLSRVVGNITFPAFSVFRSHYCLTEEGKGKLNSVHNCHTQFCPFPLRGNLIKLIELSMNWILDHPRTVCISKGY